MKGSQQTIGKKVAKLELPIFCFEPPIPPREPVPVRNLSYFHSYLETPIQKILPWSMGGSFFPQEQI